MPITKPFAIATEGPTVDGRVITRQQIEEMAKSYSPAVYTAVVNLEHYLSFYPDSAFASYGKVLELGTRETDILGEKRLQLTAVLDVSEAAAEMQYKGKKAFSSMEIMPNFIGKGITYLTGLALTDKPASLGTEPMRFSAFSDTKQKTRFDFAEETGFEIAAAPTDDGNGSAGGIVGKVKELLGISNKNTSVQLRAHAEAMSVIAASQGENAERFERAMSEITVLTSSLKDVQGILADNAKDLAAFKAALEHVPTSPGRPPATGGAGTAQTDC